MKLPVPYPLPAAEARQVDEIPAGDGWVYEPKWDGFRCLAFRDGDEVRLQSKSCKPLERYFPEVVTLLTGLGARRFVLDGELVIPMNGSLSFEQLLQRIHPAESRVRTLAAEYPALFVVFDLLLAERGGPLLDRPLRERRDRLERFAEQYFGDDARLRVSPQSSDIAQARAWLADPRTGLDGIIAKRAQAPYASGERTAMQKVKRLRTADCVVGGFRYGTRTTVVGSLLLGLYDDDGLLHHVGFTSNIPRAERATLTERLEGIEQAPGFTGRSPGGPSRWSSERSADWRPVRAELVAEVRYDHFSEGRFRHGTSFLRWRPDKAARQCTMSQLERGDASPLELL